MNGDLQDLAPGRPGRSTARAFSVSTVGGTFNTLHVGHSDYLRIAFRISEFVNIFLTSDSYAAALKRYEVLPFDVRRKEIEAFLAPSIAPHRFELHRLDSMAVLKDFALQDDLDVAIVEPRYLSLFQTLNKRRRAMGVEEYCILLKPRTRVHGIEVSSTRLQADAALVMGGTGAGGRPPGG